MRSDRATPDGAQWLRDDLLELIWEEATALETVLVVHSHASLRGALARTLEQYGYRVLEAADGEAAVEAAREERPEVVVLDLALRDAAGRAIAMEIALHPATRRSAILALSSEVIPPETLRRCGIAEALLMPAEREELLAALDRALERSRRPVPEGPRLEPEEEQCRLELGDRLRSEHLTLRFRFPAHTRVELLPENEGWIRDFAARLERLGLGVEMRVEGPELVLSYTPSLADALALGYNAGVPDELAQALRAAFPELRAEGEALERRVRALEAEYQRLQRMAS